VRANPALRTLVEDASSPVVLPAVDVGALGLSRKALFLHVEATGHAPRSLRLDFPGPSVVDVKLTEAGLLLGLTHSTAPWLFERVRLHSLVPHRFEGLPVGDLLAELFVGRAGSHYDGLRAEWVEVRRGETVFL
jgi:hypothetical protein